MLKTWIPATTDFRDQGLDPTDWVNDNVEMATDGKLGKCLYFNGSNARLSSNTYSLSEKWSWSVWIKDDLDVTGWRIVFILNSNGSDADTQTALWVKADETRLEVCNDAKWVSTVKYIPGQWNHIAQTYDGTTTNVYLNGSRISGFTSPDHLVRTNMTIGGRSTSVDGGHVSANSFFKGYLNDLRIWDGEALSPLEVKRLSQGLVLHYRLSGVGGENLATNTDFSLNSTKGYLGYKAVEYNHSDWTNGGRFFASYGHSQLTFTEIQANQPYTISAWVYIYDDVSLSDGTSIFYRVYKTKESPTYSNDIAISLNNITERNKWIRLSNTFISSATYTYDQGGTFSIGGYNGHFLVSIPKVEKGSKPTPWCPNSTDELYHTMGFDDGIEYDCSGFGNNGTKVGGILWSSDTPRYSGSYEFDGGNTCITFPYDYTALQTNFTMNIWFKKNELGSKNYETLIGGTGGFEMDTRSGASTTLSLYMASTRGGSVYAPFNMGEWYMVTLVNDGTNELYYVNGQLQKTIEKKPMPSSSTYYIGSWRGVDSQNYKGLMSDFRIYASALSSDDILSLYNLGGSLDSNGTFHTYEYVEV